MSIQILANSLFYVSRSRGPRFMPIEGSNKISDSTDVSNQSSSSENLNTTTSAINEETGEINWDCPCLKSALAPPCGEFFKEAFSCFVSSKADPKGSDCLDKFAAMQECFRVHPDIYLAEDDHETEKDGIPSSNLS